MAQPIFLTADEFFEVIQAECPTNLYPSDDATDPDFSKRSVSSSELRASAISFESVSTNLNSIYLDKFIQTAESSALTRFEQDYFTTPQDSSLSDQLRQQNLLSQIRSTGGISLPAIKAVVAGILGTTPFDLLPYSGQASVGAWILGASVLGGGTYLAEFDPINGARTENGLVPLDCNLNGAAEGLTTAQVAAIQRTAFTYAVVVYGQASDATVNLLDQTLTRIEPARSTHIIFNNQIAPTGDYSSYIASTPQYARLRL